MEVGEVSASKMVRSPRNAGSRVVLVTKNGKKKNMCARGKREWKRVHMYQRYLSLL